MLASVWVLLTVVGFPYSPKFAGKGGLNLGFPCLPSNDSSKPVSSPHIYAPAPRKLCKSKSIPDLEIFVPNKPAS